jgi:hypothetical protein
MKKIQNMPGWVSKIVLAQTAEAGKRYSKA